ncbi:MAG: macro domain-containing protein [Deltaproteobacteria bacterium]|nr:macro domain-containing protein [Deltaproteobacteria bacterium]
MMRYVQGNLLDATADALVNTVNEVGVMGKGVALMFREAFPESARLYEEACARHEVKVGRILVTENRALLGPRWILHFPTKKHWRHPSRLEWVREGLKDLVRVLRSNGIQSVAIPPLGCGNGGLEWRQVRREIEAALSDLPDVDVLVYEPTLAYRNAPKREGAEQLTPARALIAELVRRYAVLGLECTNLEVQKLAWFLRRAVRELGLEDPMKLRFEANKYGPYADQLRHLMNGLDGSYLHCEKRLADAGPFEPIWFEDSKREVVEAYLRSEAGRSWLPALDRTSEIIDGFESPLGMELLATVDWLLTENGCEPTVAGLKSGLEQWPGGRTAVQRKLRVLTDRLLELALARVASSASHVAGSPKVN